MSIFVLSCSRILLVQGEVYCLPCGGWTFGYLPTYLPSFFPSSREKISQRKSNRQPLHSELDTSPLSPGSSWSSRTTIVFKIECRVAINVWKRSPISFQHVSSLLYFLFDLHRMHIPIKCMDPIKENQPLKTHPTLASFSCWQPKHTSMCYNLWSTHIITLGTLDRR